MRNTFVSAAVTVVMLWEKEHLWDLEEKHLGSFSLHFPDVKWKMKELG